MRKIVKYILITNIFGFGAYLLYVLFRRFQKKKLEKRKFEEYDQVENSMTPKVEGS